MEAKSSMGRLLCLTFAIVDSRPHDRDCFSGCRTNRCGIDLVENEWAGCSGSICMGSPASIRIDERK